MSKMRFGLIGLGTISDYHIEAIKALSDRAELSVVCCRTEARGREVAASQECRWTSDYRDSFPDCDALIVATPHHLHYPMLKDAILAGVKNVLLEKPIANHPGEVDELIELADEHGCYVQVGYELRQEPAIQVMKQVIDEKRFGPPTMALLRTEHGFTPEEFSQHLAWAGKVETLGGGVLFSHGCHYVDILIWMLGDVVESVGVRNKTLLREVMEGEDSAIANFKFESGVIGSYMATWAVIYRELAIDYRVYCTEGQVVFQQLEDASTKLYAITENGHEDLRGEGLFAASGPTDGFVTHATFIRQLENFLRETEDRSNPSRSLHQGRKSLDAIWQAYENSPV